MAGFCLVMIPAGASHNVRGRLRLPLDLLFIPVAVLFVQAMVSVAARRIRRRPSSTPPTSIAVTEQAFERLRPAADEPPQDER